MSELPFHQVDVFTDTSLRGNPVAVVVGADGLDEEQMRTLASWTNLSETAFVMAPMDAAADYRVRIFTPNAELPFAGHPTLGACHAWLADGGTPSEDALVLQECGVGLVRIRRAAGRLAFAAPSVDGSDVSEATLARVVRALGLPPGQVVRSRLLVNGPTWLVLLVPDAATVLALEPDHTALAELPEIGVVGLHPPGSECAIEVRAFADCVGIPEDPVTGSLQASVAQWLIGAGVLPERYVAAQGTRLGRLGRVEVESDGGDVWVGGGTRSTVIGRLHL